MSNDKARAEFEAWLVEFLSEGDMQEIAKARSVDSSGETVYRFGDDLEATMGITAMWIGWQASRAALVVELPPAPVPQKRYEGRYTQVESAYHQGQMSVTRAIEAAGVRVKP